MAVQGLKFAWTSVLNAKGVAEKKYGASLKGSQDTEKNVRKFCKNSVRIL